MVLTINDVEAAVTCSLVRCNQSKNVFLNFFVRNTALEWLFIDLKARTDGLSNGGQVNNLAVVAIGDTLGYE